MRWWPPSVLWIEGGGTVVLYFQSELEIIFLHFLLTYTRLLKLLQPLEL